MFAPKMVMFETICLFLFLFAAIVQACFCILVFWQLYRHKNLDNNDKVDDSDKVSVIICAKNEAANLLKNLPLVLAQKYGNMYEVLVVDDDSDDGSADVLAKMAAKYAHLRVINTKGLDRKLSGKKHALNFGILAAKYNTLLLTDADCEPSSCHWLRFMVQNLSHSTQKQIVLGISPYFAQKKYGLLHIIIQYETAYTALQYVGFALWGVPYMGVGRNLAYKKTVFTSAKGFDSHAKVASGDDDLLIGQVATAQNTAIEIRPESYCYSQPPTNWFLWFKQKKRHLSAGTHYAQKHQARLGLLVFSHIMLYLSIISCIFVVPNQNVIILSVLIVSLKTFFVKKIFHKLHFNNTWGEVVIGDLLLFLYYIFFIPLSPLIKKTSWK